MTEGEKTRLVAWSQELRAVHQRLRRALRVTRASVRDGTPGEAATRDLLLLCHGFCAALNGHHRGEDRELFPALAASHPELGETLRALEQDHSMIGYLADALKAAAERGASAAELDRHLEGIAAIMESHFRYEERQLLHVLDSLALDASPQDVFGSL